MKSFALGLGVGLVFLVACAGSGSDPVQSGAGAISGSGGVPSAPPAAAPAAPAAPYAPAPASPTTYTAVLDAAQETAPPPEGGPRSLSSATGIATLSFDPATSRLTGTVSFTGLSGPPIASLIHEGGCGVAGDVEITLGEAAVSSPITVDVGVEADAEAALSAGKLYINLHTDAFPAGEIRGQILAAGAPACAAATPASDAGMADGG